MIHPMWSEFAKVALGVVYDCATSQPDETPRQCRERVAIVSAHLADLMCAEYDKRNGVTGSPYRDGVGK